MRQTCQRTSVWPRLLAVLSLALAVSFSAQHPTHAAADTPEREQLAALARLLDLIDRLTEHTASITPQERARYHFDYTRLRADLKRIHAGVQNYLVPQRAQPRDPIPLTGDYVRRNEREESTP